MHKQTEQRSERILESVPDPGLTLETGVVVVAPGVGNRRLFESYGAAKVIEGGQTMNPSTADIVAAIQATCDRGARAAEQLERDPLGRAGGEARRQAGARPVPLGPAGLAAIVRYLPSLTAEENEAGMLEALDQSRPARSPSPRATSSSTGWRCARGPGSAADGAAVASSSDFDEVACAVAEKLLGNGREVLTLLTGEDEPDLAGLLKRIEELHPAVELDIHPGGQPHYPLLLSAE